MQIFTTPLLIAVLALLVGIYLPHTDAQATCATTGCLNGVCLLPPAVAVPTCSCSQGFQLDPTNATICNDIDECAPNPYICGYGRCVNTPGSYYCMCYPPYVAIYPYTSCFYYQPPQQNFFQNPFSLFLFDDLFDFDLF
ncbi:adhesion G protein-coupled receptor E2-like [Haliotis asinina]|uniref:adhesion G protein-coupled receptor E2-like n=1 Tax=Haliotis asinina TaxID=109174 RepID=UPI00353259C9